MSLNWEAGRILGKGFMLQFQAVLMITFLHNFISKAFITNEDMFLGFKIVAIEERKLFDLIIFVFWQVENGPLLSSIVICSQSKNAATVYHGFSYAFLQFSGFYSY